MTMHIDPQLKEELKKYIENKLHDNKQRVTVVSPFKLNDKDLDMLKKTFPQFDKAIIDNEVDSSLLAGVIVKFGTKMIDLSLKTELQNLKQMIYESA